MEFDHQAIEAALRDEWAAQGGGDDPFAADDASVSIFSVQPEIDSLGVVRLLLAVEEYLGFEAPPCIIRRGGYWSCDAMVADLVPKLKEMHAEKVRKAA